MPPGALRYLASEARGPCAGPWHQSGGPDEGEAVVLSSEMRKCIFIEALKRWLLWVSRALALCFGDLGWAPGPTDGIRYAGDDSGPCQHKVSKIFPQYARMHRHPTL